MHDINAISPLSLLVSAPVQAYDVTWRMRASPTPARTTPSVKRRRSTDSTAVLVVPDGRERTARLTSMNVTMVSNYLLTYL